MKIAGEAAAHGSVEAVWDRLHDADVLARAIPGCEHFEVSGPGLVQFIATTALPAISGTYSVKLTIIEQQRPSLLRLTAAATGDQGTVTADVTVRLSHTATATTLVNYEANGTVTGPVAAIGARLLTSAAKRFAGDFFGALNESAAAKSATPVEEPAAAEVSAARPARVVSDADRPRALARPVPRAENRGALLAGAAIGVAGIIIGVLAGRRGGRAGRVEA